MKQAAQKRLVWFFVNVFMIVPAIISLWFFFLYVGMQITSIYAGDSGELVSAAYTWGIAHPPGYPLYMLLGGIITHSLPYNTVAWRMGLLSSFPMALSIFFLWRVVFFLTSSFRSATYASILYGFLYPVWLYAIVPEVFGMFSLFSIVLWYLFLLYTKTRNLRYAYLFAFIAGLSLTHHHLIVLLLVSVGLYWWIRRVLLPPYPQGLIAIGIFFLGCSVYLYAPLVSLGYPAFDWEHPADMSGFIRLVTRASYGTFKASVGTGQTIVDRGLNVLSLVQFILVDFTVVGIGFFIAGIVGIWKQLRKWTLFFLLYAGLLIFYFFYAGFSLTSDFTQGTLERFFIIPYQYFAVVSGVGLWWSTRFLGRYWQKHAKSISIPFSFIAVGIVAVALMIPCRLVLRYYPKLALLKHDRTLERFSDDILASVPQGSIVNVSDDTSSFALFYSYYVLKKRQDIALVTFPFFQFSYYPRWIKKHYSDVAVPETANPVSYASYLKSFIQANALYRPVLTERVDISVPEHWVPRGLLVMYYDKLEDIPPREQIFAKNKELWDGFHNPLDGVLGTYRHMMLTDVLRNYSEKRLTLAHALLLFGNVDSAQHEAQKTLVWTPDRLEMYLPYWETLLERGHCAEALTVLHWVQNTYMSRYAYVELFHKIYEQCPALQEMVKEQEREYQELMRLYGTRIE